VAQVPLILSYIYIFEQVGGVTCLGSVQPENLIQIYHVVYNITFQMEKTLHFPFM